MFFNVQVSCRGLQLITKLDIFAEKDPGSSLPSFRFRLNYCQADSDDIVSIDCVSQHTVNFQFYNRILSENPGCV